MEIRTWRSAIADLRGPPPGAPSDALGEGNPGWVWRCDAAISRYKEKMCLFGRFFTCSQNSSLRNKRPDLSGRPPCKGVAIGVARRGGRLGGERTLRVPPCCSFPVSHSGGPHVVSFVAGRRSCALGARVRAGVARRAAEGVRASWRGKACRKKEEEEKRSAGQRRTKDRGPRQEGKLRACRRVGEYYGGSVAVRAQ